MKKLIYIFTATVLGASICACNDDASSGDSKKSDFEIACENSGGTYQSDYRCSCDATLCDEGAICNFMTKACTSNVTEPTEKCTTGSNTCVSSKLYECKDKQWERVNPSNPVDCEYGCRADASACAECINDDIICKDNKLYICNDNHYEEKESCPAGCDEITKNTCSNTCPENAILCIDGTLKTCHNNKYDDGTKCPNDASCASNTECGECTNGESTCVNDEFSYIGQMTICKEGKYTTQTCESNTSCSSTTSCGKCLNDTIECVNDEITKKGQIKTCISGEYIIEDCESGHSCDLDQNCGECHDGDIRCMNNEMNIGQIEICENGKYKLQELCESNNSCASETECGECWNGNTLCENDPETQVGQSQKCIEGKYVKGGAFADGTFLKGMSCGSVSCHNNTCGYCLNGMHKWCDAKDPLLTNVWECNDGGIKKTLCSTVEPGSRCHSSTTGDATCAK